MWFRHAKGIECFGQNVVRQDVLLAAEFANRLAGFESLFGQGCGFLVTDVRVEACYHRQAFLDAGLADFGVGFHLFGAELDKRDSRVGEQLHAFERRLTHHRHHDVELEVAARRPGDVDRRVVADDAGGDLHHALAHDRIHLPRHDTAARLAIGKL